MNYKLKELKVYSSTEWLADNKKKYRQVFDRMQTQYVYAELSFHNLLYDKDDWEAKVVLKCFAKKEEGKDPEMICELPFTRKVNKFDDIVYFREGWGNKNFGSFWKEGTYYWEAWIEGKMINKKYFYIEDAGGVVDYSENPYVELVDVNLYEGPFEDIPYGEREYMVAFKPEDTRYVYVELTLKNLYPEQNWHCEIFVRFFNNARELKGQVVRFQEVEKGAEYIRLSGGWGSNVKGSWREDIYTAEVVFMENALGVIPFEMDEFRKGKAGVIFPHEQMPEILGNGDGFIDNDERTFEEVLKDLNALIGLAAIKKQVRDHASYIKFLQLRKEKGFEEKDDINVHSVFIGNPGTGKTTVAKMMGKLYKKMGLLSRGHVHEVDRVDLVGEYIGQTAPKVKEVIEKARGGVLFIDEAYSLARTPEDKKDFGREVIEILVKEMSDGKGDMAVIVAGYPKEMKNFLESNPGLSSRFKLYFEFADYLPQELMQIADFAAIEKEVKITPAARKRINEYIVKAFRTRSRSFGNARFVFDLIEKAKVQLGLRVMKMNAPEELEQAVLSTVKLEDVKNIEVEKVYQLPDIPIDQELLDEAMGELNRLIGMTNIKMRIKEMVELVKYYRETGKDVLNKFYLHTVLIGNPGTGKTTVARILTKIYKALGVLERGHIVETDRQGLVAGYVGQTAIKTAEKIEEALGGVLFIDEAYSLSEGSSSGRGNFGNEAIQTLLKRMEDLRGRFFVFVAGYPDNMESFLKANPGLNSRFDKVLKFEDYSPADLFEIAKLMLQEEGLKLNAAAEKHVQEYLSFIHEFRDKYFGNARSVRQAVHEAVKAHNLRLAALSPEQRVGVQDHILNMEDVAVLKTDKSDFVFNRKSIGFRSRG